MNPPRIQGIVPPVPTPLRHDLAIDAEGFHRIARHLEAGGVDAAFLLGSTGELASLSRRLRRQALHAAGEAFRGRLPWLAGIGDPCLEESLELAHLAAEHGASAVVVHAPSYYEISGRELRRWLDALLPQLPLPVMLYHMPWLTGHRFDDETLRHAIGFPGVIGFKDSSGDLAYFANLVRLASARPELTVLVGSDHLLLDALRLGGHGAIAGGANFYPARFAGLVQAFRRGDLTDAAAIQERITRLSHRIFPLTGEPCSCFAAVKGGMAALGLCRPEMLPPLTTCSPAEIETLRLAIESARPATDAQTASADRCPVPSSAA